MKTPVVRPGRQRWQAIRVGTCVVQGATRAQGQRLRVGCPAICTVLSPVTPPGAYPALRSHEPLPLTGCPRATPVRRAGPAPLDFWLRVGSATPTGKPGMTLTRPWGAVAEAGKAQVRKPHLRPRRGGGSRASGGRQSGCGHYPRGSRQRRDRCLIGASALLGICTKRLEGTSAVPTGNPSWRLRHTGCVLRAEAALCLTNEPARLSSGRWPAAPRGDAKGGNALWRAFASFWRVPKGWRRAGAQPRPGMPLGAMPRKVLIKAWGAVPVAARPGAN